jgi:dihydroorotate dehydrogenase electron transfer subunit
MGIAPIYFLARRILQRMAACPEIHILLGARNKTELQPLVDDFKGSGFRVQVTTDDGSLGHHGYVPELLPNKLSTSDIVYACGPRSMMENVAAQCAGVGKACQVSLESHMACGIGACLGCTIQGTGDRYIHVCKHGPVLDASEVQWK